MFRSVVFGVMALTIFKQNLPHFDTLNQFEDVKCLRMTKTKHLRKVKQKGKRLFPAMIFPYRYFIKTDFVLKLR